MKKFYLLVIVLAILTIFTVNNNNAFATAPTEYSDWGKGAKWPAWLDSKTVDKDTVSQAITKGIYNGYPDKTLRLTNTITCAEFATALSRVLNTGTENSQPWYKENVDALIAKGIITNTGGNWNAPITRAEMGQWMGRAVNKYNDTKQFNRRDISFTDTSDPDIISAASVGIINGVSPGKFNPTGNAARVEAALMLMRFVEPVNFAIYGETYVANGYIIPTKTDLDIDMLPASDNPNKVDIAIAIRLQYPHEHQYQDAYNIMASKFGEKLANEIVDYAKQKKTDYDDLPIKHWLVNDQQINVGSNKGNYWIVITIWEPGV